MSNHSSDDEQISTGKEEHFQRQKPIEEFDDDVKPSQHKTRIDEDGTEYEWDPRVRGWFPKVSEQYLVEHHMNYGLDSKQFQFDSNTNCYTFVGQDGQRLRLDPESNRWVPFDAQIQQDGDRRYFMHPQYKMEFVLRAGSWEPSNQSFFTDANTGLVFVWSRPHGGFVDSRCLQEYEDILTGVRYKWNDDHWDIVGAQVEATKAEDDEEKVKDGCFVLPDNMNRNVYVSSLPLDMTDEEFFEMMSKYGLIASDSENGKPKVKLYKDSDGKPKGDGICTYVKVESVDLCLNILDGTCLRGSTIQAERAQFKIKGEYDPSKKRKRKNKDKISSTKFNKRRLGWDEDGAITARPKHERILVLRNLIEPGNAFMPFSTVSVLKEDVKVLFSEYAKVRDVRVFPQAGVITVGFLSPDEADKCLEYVNGRLWKNGQTMECTRWDGKTKFDQDTKEDDVDDEERIQRWHKFIAQGAEEDEDDQL